MNKFHFWHRPKSEYAYAYDDKTLHLKLVMKELPKGDVFVVYGDPFEWVKGHDISTWVNDREKMELRYVFNDTYVYFASLKPKYLRMKYQFIIMDENTIYHYGSRGVAIEDTVLIHDLSNCFNFPYLSKEDIHQIPVWAKDRIWYQIFVDRFNCYDQVIDPKTPALNHLHLGGNLRGITQKLNDLVELGINGIYLTPIFESPSAHKYDTTNYFKIDPHFGIEEDLKELVEKAHQRDIKVMLDGVFNHAGFFHPYFQDVIKKGQSSPYQSCFHIHEFPVINFPLNEQGKPVNYKGIPLRYQTFSFQPYMPKWNTESKLTQDYLLKVVSYWIKACDIDGWRLDVSNEISHTFLRKIKEVAKNIKPDVFILGENWDQGTPWLMGDQIDSVMNYESSFDIWDYLTYQIDGKTLTNQIIQLESQTQEDVLDVMFNLIGSHDTMRLSHRLNHDIKRIQQAFLLLFLLKGTPMIYYGDEIGLEGSDDPDNRRMMDWDTSHWKMDIYQFVKRLIKIKKTYHELFLADLTLISSEPLIWMKQTDNEQMIIILNQNKEKVYQIPKKLEGRYIHLIDDKIMSFHDTIELEINAIYLLHKEVSHETNHS
ncbi:MAG: glycoside hydrolase family 13 protein [Acholeplasmataceae bacterium]|jgi:glycosidase|nr:glycoside hydrolase family 13 protein [Acholeplasmataceae bacterium]